MDPMEKDLLFRAAISFGGILLTIFGMSYVIGKLDPTRKERSEAKKLAKELMARLGLRDVVLNEYELVLAQHVVPPDEGTKWTDVGGYNELIEEIKDTLLLPLRIAKTSPLLSPPKGVLLHGPPGCGKTMIAQAVARSAGARFINLQISTMLDKWYGESQKYTSAIFSLAKKLQPTIIFIDEIDSFLRTRNAFDHESTSMMKAEFLSLWDGFQSDPQSEIIIMGATNRPRDVDPAVLRRMPLKFHIGMPTAIQRKLILEVILRNEELTQDVDLASIAQAAESCSGSDLKEICRLAAISRVKKVMDGIRHDDEWSESNISSRSLRYIQQPHITHGDLEEAMAKYLNCKSLRGLSDPLFASTSSVAPMEDPLD